MNKLVGLARETAPDGRRPADDPLVRDAIARQWVELQALRYTNYRSLTTLIKHGVPGPEGSIAKLHWSESNQRLTKLALSVQGLAAQLDGAGGVWNGYWQYQQLRSRGNTIEAGTSEILRNIVAERVVGPAPVPLTSCRLGHPGHPATSGKEKPEMDFAFSADQEALRAVARDFLANEFPIGRVAELAESEAGWDRRVVEADPRPRLAQPVGTRR